MQTKVLIAVEDKEFGEAIAKFVIGHDWGDEPEFKIVNVVEHPLIQSLLENMSESVKADVTEERIRRGKALTMAIGTELRTSFPKAKIIEAILDGSPAQQVLKEAADWSADFIVLGSHGKPALDRMLLGSVSLSVLSHAPCSVLIVKLPQAEPAEKHDKKMVVLY
jgi:nucleotide-binding universal stress UspA family protein